jgi:hypothetical protein
MFWVTIYIACYVFANFSEEDTASIFYPEDGSSLFISAYVVNDEPTN